PTRRGFESVRGGTTCEGGSPDRCTLGATVPERRETGVEVACAADPDSSLPSGNRLLSGPNDSILCECQSIEGLHHYPFSLPLRAGRSSQTVRNCWFFQAAIPPDTFVTRV